MSDTLLAMAFAEDYCRHHPGWIPIFLLPKGSDHLYKTWDELSPRQKRVYTREYKPERYARFQYENMLPKICKVSEGWIAPDGSFSKGYQANACMIFKVGLTPEVKKLLLNTIGSLVIQHKEALKNGTYAVSFTHFPKEIRDGIVWWNTGRGWRLRKDWQNILADRIVETILPSPVQGEGQG